MIITATKSGYQHFETNFADFFLEALASKEADFNNDKRISMLEAFKFARNNQDKWFEEQRRIRAEHPLFDDNGDGKGNHDLEGASDGRWASRVYLGPISEELEATLEKIKSGKQTSRDTLLLKKLALEQQIEDLKAKKPQMDFEDYMRQLEALLIQLA